MCKHHVLGNTIDDTYICCILYLPVEDGISIMIPHLRRVLKKKLALMSNLKRWISRLQEKVDLYECDFDEWFLSPNPNFDNHLFCNFENSTPLFAFIVRVLCSAGVFRPNFRPSKASGCLAAPGCLQLLVAFLLLPHNNKSTFPHSTTRSNNKMEYTSTIPP